MGGRGDAASERLVGDGAEGGHGEVVRANELVELRQFHSYFSVDNLRRSIDLRGETKLVSNCLVKKYDTMSRVDREGGRRAAQSILTRGSSD